MKKTAEEMKKQISLFVEYKDHDRVILSNANGDAFSSKSEDLIDFLHGIKDTQASDLPSREAELNKYIKKFAAQDQCIGFCDGFDTVYSIASPLLASHVARILELEEALKSIQAIVDKGHKPEFDFEVEYWDSGNHDDSYSYGREVGEQYVFQDILKILTPKP